MEPLDQQTIQQLFSYSPEENALYWLKPTGGRVHVGDRAGCLDGRTSSGDRWVCINGRTYAQKRLIALYTGAYAGQKGFTLRRYANKTGFSGIARVTSGARGERFIAQFRRGGVSNYIVCWKTAIEASEAYEAFVLEYITGLNGTQL